MKNNMEESFNFNRKRVNKDVSKADIEMAEFSVIKNIVQSLQLPFEIDLGGEYLKKLEILENECEESLFASKEIEQKYTELEEKFNNIASAKILFSSKEQEKRFSDKILSMKENLHTMKKESEAYSHSIKEKLKIIEKVFLLQRVTESESGLNDTEREQKKKVILNN